MAYNARILADSANADPSGPHDRLTTMELTLPRFVHAEQLRHRMMSFSVGSSRAVPTAKLLAQIMDDPVMPAFWGKLQSGMSASEEMRGCARRRAERAWLLARDEAVRTAEQMLGLGVHKQIVNRILEPWMWVTTIVSATEWENFFALRSPSKGSASYLPDRMLDPLFPAQPEIQVIARMAEDAYRAAEPSVLPSGGWHLPLFGETEVDGDEIAGDADVVGTIMLPGAETALPKAVAVSAGRTARVSYLTHDGQRDVGKDLELASRLAASHHWSPLEHPARAVAVGARCANFRGFQQARFVFPGEAVATR